MRSRFYFLFTLFPILLFPGIFDWFANSSKEEKLDFYCPHHCGEWGSESIQQLEWKFIQCLYDAQLISYYIEKNLFKRSQEYQYKIKYSMDFTPAQFEFPYKRPQNFASQWYQKLQDSDNRWMVCLSNCIPDRWGCFRCKRSLWKITHIDNIEGDHIGKKFMRTATIEYDDGDYSDDDDEDDDQGSYYERIIEESEYRFGSYIDFYNACLYLEDDLCLETTDNKCREFTYSPIFAEQIKAQFSHALQFLAETKDMHHKIYDVCAKNHGSPTAFYHLALEAFSKGDHETSLEYLTSFFHKVKLDVIESNLASEIFESIGSIESEVMLYDEAISNLSQAIEANPQNKEAYFERAIAYFEKGEYDLSIEDYIKSGMDVAPLPFNLDPYLIDYARSIPMGALRGIKEASTEFFPNVCSSLRGVGNLLWATVANPIESSKYLASCVIEFYQFLRSCENAELAEILVPEMYKLVVDWDQLRPKQRGERAGYCLGKYGTDVFLPIAAIKGAKYVKNYREIKKAEKFCNLKTLTKSPESKESLTKAATEWNERRAIWLQQLEIEIDKQNKHIRGTRNFIEGHSEWIHPNPMVKLKELAGKGQKIRGEIGKSGYRERIDCGEVIGYYINDVTKEKLPTTMAIIHYSKKGAHIVPASPKK